DLRAVGRKAGRTAIAGRNDHHRRRLRDRHPFRSLENVAHGVAHALHVGGVASAGAPGRTASSTTEASASPTTSAPSPAAGVTAASAALAAFFGGRGLVARVFVESPHADD